MKRIVIDLFSFSIITVSDVVLTRGDLELQVLVAVVVVFTGVDLTIGDVRRGVSIVCARVVTC